MDARTASMLGIIELSVVQRKTVSGGMTGFSFSVRSSFPFRELHGVVYKLRSKHVR
jgi:hypothetical protein